MSTIIISISNVFVPLANQVTILKQFFHFIEIIFEYRKIESFSCGAKALRPRAYARVCERIAGPLEIENSGLDCLIHPSESSQILRTSAFTLKLSVTVLDFQPEAFLCALPSCPGSSLKERRSAECARILPRRTR
jgi:hypothetical protein